MKKFLLAITAMFASFAMATAADVDIWHMPDVMTSQNFVKFKNTRIELIAGTENFRFGASILNVGAIVNNLITTFDTVTDKDVASRQGLMFIPSMFASFNAKFNGWGIGIGYQYDLTRLQGQEDGVFMKHIAFSHGIAIAATAVEDKLWINVPFFIGAANAKAYGAAPTGSTTAKMPVIFSMEPWIRWNFDGPVMNYFKGTVKFGTISKIAGENGDKSPASFGIRLDMMYTYITDPITIYSEPWIAFDMGINSTRAINASSAANVAVWDTYWAKGEKNAAVAQIFYPVRFKATINDTISVYGEPSLHVSYIVDGYDVISEIGASSFRKDAFGIGYGLLLGTVFNPVENLEVGIELKWIGDISGMSLSQQLAGYFPESGRMGTGLDLWVQYNF